MARSINRPTSSREYHYYGQHITLERRHYASDHASNRRKVEETARPRAGYSIVARMSDRDDLAKVRYTELCGTVTDEPRSLEHALLEVATRLNVGVYCTITTPTGTHYYAITESPGVVIWGREHHAELEA